MSIQIIGSDPEAVNHFAPMENFQPVSRPVFVKVIDQGTIIHLNTAPQSIDISNLFPAFLLVIIFSLTGITIYLRASERPIARIAYILFYFTSIIFFLININTKCLDAPSSLHPGNDYLGNGHHLHRSLTTSISEAQERCEGKVTSLTDIIIPASNNWLRTDSSQRTRHSPTSLGSYCHIITYKCVYDMLYGFYCLDHVLGSTTLELK